MLRTICLLTLLVSALARPGNENESTSSVKESEESYEVVQPNVPYAVEQAIVSDAINILRNNPLENRSTVIYVDPSKINFHLYNKEFRQQPLEITEDTVDQVDPNLPSKVIIPGWITSNTDPLIMKMKNAYLKMKNRNVFVVDWTTYAFLPYGSSVATVPGVGTITAQFLEALSMKRKYNSTNMHLIGHNLGAHAAGYAGRFMKHALHAPVARITGLDAAGPRFQPPSVNTPQMAHLTKADAKFVDGIHTNCGINGAGYKTPFGTIDFYPNGGKQQPGCPILNSLRSLSDVVLSRCSANRALEYFTESISSNKFVARACDSFPDYENGKCNENPANAMGEHVDQNGSGKYYLTTNRSPPYAQGEK